MLDRFGPLDEKIIKAYIKQILEGLQYLHSKGIFHKNLKCSNILVDNDATIKLTDFGVSKLVSFMNSLKKEKDENALKGNVSVSSYSIKSAPNWIAPEINSGKPNLAASDVWSVGCVMIEMGTAKPLCADIEDNISKIFEYISDSAEKLAILEATFSENALSFLKCCLKKNPEERMSVGELLSHPFLTNKNEDMDAQEIVKKMSFTLQKEMAERKGITEKNNSDEEVERIYINSSELDDSYETFGAKNAQEKGNVQKEEERKRKEENRKKWEEELKKELERQKMQ